MAKKDLQATKDAIALEREYQQALSFSAQVQRDINKEINAGIDGRTKVGEAVKEYNKELMSSVAQIQSSEDAAKLLVDLENERKDILKSSNGSNKEVNDGKVKSNDITREGIQLEYERLAAAEEMDKVQKGVTGKVIGQIDAIEAMGSNIPIVGGLFSEVFGGAFEGLRNHTLEAGKTMVRQFAAGGMSLKNLTQSMAQFGGSILKYVVANPFVLVGIAIVGVIALLGTAMAAFSKLASAAATFRQETGLLNSQTDGLQKNIYRAYSNTSKLGASMEDAAKAGAAFTNTFDGVEQPSAAVLENMIVLNKNFGVAVQTGAEVTKLFRNMSGLSAEAAQNQTALVAEASKLAGVAPQKVMADIASNTETAYQFFGGSVTELSKAAVQAAKMGTSISAMADTAKGLLDFESSITKELEASAMLGQSVNFNRARELAATGDLLGMQKAVMDELEGVGDISKMNYYQQQKIAEASGMTVDEIKKQQKIRTQLGKLGDDELAAANALLDSGTELNESNLKAKTKELAAQQEMQSKVDTMKNTFSAIGSSIMMSLAPIGEVIFDVLNMVGGFLLPMFKNAGRILKIAFAPVQIAMGVISSMMSPIIDAFSDMQDSMTPLFDKVDDAIISISKFLQPIAGFIGNIMATSFKIIGAIAGILVDVFSSFLTPLINGLSFVGGLIGDYIIDPIMYVYDAVASAFSGIGGLFSGIGDSAGGIFDAIGSAIEPIFGFFVKIGKIITLPFRILMAGMKAIGKIIMDNVISPMISFGKGLIAPIISGFNMVSSFIMGTIIDPMVEFFGALLNPLIEGFQYVGSIVQQYIVDPIMGAIDFLAGLNPTSWFSDDEVPDPEVASADVTSTMGTAGEQSLEAQQLKVAGSIDDGIVQNGNIISTDPEDTLIATKTPSELIPQASAELIPQAPDITKPVAEKKSNLFGDGVMGKMIGMTPIGMAANAVNDAGGIEGAISGIGDFVGGLFGGGDESESLSNKELLAKMDVLIQAVRQSGNISMDGKAVTEGVQLIVEKKTSNSFGLV